MDLVGVKDSRFANFSQDKRKQLLEESAKCWNSEEFWPVLEDKWRQNRNICLEGVYEKNFLLLNSWRAFDSNVTCLDS